VTEEVELARACGERLMDALAGEQIAQRLMSLLRGRLGELQVISTRHKRVLHDEVLPDIHAALLTLQAGAAAPDSVRTLSRAHRTISELLQAGPRSAAAELQARGFVGALREAVDSEFSGAFESVVWSIDPQLEPRLQGAGGQVAGEVAYFAALEAVRNAARHAAGSQGGRRVRLEIAANWEAGLALTVADDGVGLDGGAAAFGGEGLLLHSTMMAVVGGELSVKTGEAGRGTVARLWLPAAGLQTQPDPLEP
jgi:signal transduction histidine kinase